MAPSIEKAAALPARQAHQIMAWHSCSLCGQNQSLWKACHHLLKARCACNEPCTPAPAHSTGSQAIAQGSVAKECCRMYIYMCVCMSTHSLRPWGIHKSSCSFDAGPLNHAQPAVFSVGQYCILTSVVGPATASTCILSAMSYDVTFVSKQPEGSASALSRSPRAHTAATGLPHDSCMPWPGSEVPCGFRMHLRKCLRPALEGTHAQWWSGDAAYAAASCCLQGLR